MLVVVITAATLSHGYASDICKPLGCMHAIQNFETATMAGMVVTSIILLLRVVKYQNVEYSTVRNRSTLIVVCTASAHTVFHNLEQWLADIYSPLLIIATFFLLALAGRLLTNPSTMWPADAGAKTADRNYYETMIDDWVFVFTYWVFITVGLWVVWVLDIAGWLFEDEPLTMLVVGLFGPLIALYFANRERNKRIEENMSYKILVLSHIQTILLIIRARVRQQSIAGAKDHDAELRMTNQTGDEMPIYRDERVHTHAINTNTYVPARVRTMLSHIMRDADSLFLPNRHIIRRDKVLRWLLGDIDMLINHVYFTDDRDPIVRKSLREAKDIIQDAKELIAKP